MLGALFGREQAVSAEAVQDRSEVAAQESGHLAKRILLVDKEPELLQLVRGILAEAGYVVETSWSFHNAKERLLRRDYDLVITEVVIGGGGTGNDLASMAKAYGMAYLLVTGDPDQMLIMQLKHDRYLAKPFLPETLLEVVNRVWSGG